MESSTILKYGYTSFPLGEDISNIKKALSGLTVKPRNWEIINIPEARRVLLNEKIIHTLRGLYPDEKYHLTSFSTNISGSEYGCWHTDHPYNRGTVPDEYKNCSNPDQPLGIQVIITLDDFTEENGATQYKSAEGERKSFVCPAGTVIMYQASLWHRAGKNNTNKERMAILANFSPLHIPPLDIWDSPQLYEQIKPDDNDFIVRDGLVRYR